MTRKDGHNKEHHKTNGAPQKKESSDPLHRLPILGSAMQQADRLRHRLPLVGEHLTRADADVLRLEARALRFAASQLEARARQLDRLRKNEEPTKPQRIQVE